MPKSARRGRRNARRRALAAVDAKLGPDTTELVHTFADGWSIRRLTTATDLQREGALMGHCGGTAEYVEMLEGGQVDILSLRDLDGHPVASFMHSSTHSYHEEGKGSTPLKPEHRQRIEQWHATLPYAAQWLHAALIKDVTEATLQFEQTLAVLTRLDQWTGPAHTKDVHERLDPVRLYCLQRITHLLLRDQPETPTDDDAAPTGARRVRAASRNQLPSASRCPHSLAARRGGGEVPQR